MLGKKKPTSAYKANNYKDHSYVARNTEVIGDIVFAGGLHVEGRVTGNILSDEGSLHVHGEVTGEVRVPHIVINGLVNGNVYASEHIELAAKAQVNGNVHYKTMEMVMGAQVNGSLLHSDKPVARIEHKPETATEPAPAATEAAKG
ncbi:MAG: polymer-forming cytoskeletal protein [Moraxellaceae bacterium]